MTRIAWVAIAAMVASGLAGCGERPQVVDYQQGKYSGKTDLPPWDGARFAGNKQAWESAINQRTQAQNETQRTVTAIQNTPDHESHDRFPRSHQE